MGEWRSCGADRMRELVREAVQIRPLPARETGLRVPSPASGNDWTGRLSRGSSYQQTHCAMSGPKIIAFPSNGVSAAPPEPGVAVPFRDMKTDLIEKAAKVIPNPPVLVNLVSRRVRQLNQGRAPLINPASYGMRLGQGDIALLEIIEGKISAEFSDVVPEEV